MKRKLILINYFIPFVFFVFSCTPKETKNKVIASEERKMNQPEYPIQLDLPAKGDDTLKASLFAQSIKYVSLETSPETFLHYIKKIEINDSIIAVADSKKLLLIDHEGKFIRRIGRNGNGPGEYNMIFRFALLDDTLYISSSGKYGIIKYTLDGTFQEELKLDFQPYYFCSTPDKEFLCYNRYEGTVETFDRNFKTIQKQVVEYNVSKERWKWMMVDPIYLIHLYSGNNNVLFTNYISDTIWNVSKGNKKAEIILNQGGKLLPWNKQIEYFNGDFEKFTKQSEPYQMINVMETPSYLFLFQKGWQEQKLNSIYIHDLKTNRTQKFETPYIFDDVVGRQNLGPEYFNKDYIISTVSPIKLSDDLKNDNVDKNVNAGWLEKMRNIKEDDNPVLVLVKAKNLGE